MSKAKPMHYLLSLSVGPTNMHGYLISDDATSLERTADHMLTTAEGIAKKHGLFSLPVILMTGPLEKATCKMIEKYISGQNEEVANLIKSCTNFHFTMWLMADDSPMNKKLMEIH